jgi:phosphoribosylpyrophosphate synthetase
LSQHLISGSALSGVRNTVYDVDGKRVQINVIVTPDAGNAEKLMTRLRSMKAEIALLQKKRTIYEFIGQNDVLLLIAEGHKYL